MTIKLKSDQITTPLTTKGDVYTYSTIDDRLTVGTVDGYVLTVDSAADTGLKWVAAGTASPLTTKGDIYTYSTTNDKLPVPAFDGYFLSTDSTKATGLNWVSHNPSGYITPNVLYQSSTLKTFFSGAVPVYNSTNNALVMGYYDEFLGNSLGAQWSTDLGTDGTASVSGGALTVTDGTSGSDAPLVKLAGLEHGSWEVVFHVTCVNANTDNSGGLWVFSPSLSSLFIYTHLQQGTIRVGNGPSTHTNTGVSASAAWLRMKYSGGNVMYSYNTAAAHTAEPAQSAYTIINGVNVVASNTHLWFPSFICFRTDAFGAVASNYAFRHFRFRYL